MAIRLKEDALTRAQAIARQIGILQEVDVELNGLDDEFVFEHLEKHGCVVQRYLDCDRATVYLVTNKRPEVAQSALVML